MLRKTFASLFTALLLLMTTASSSLHAEPIAALSPDGMIPDQGPATALRALVSVEPALSDAKIDLKSVYTNDFVKKANAKYPNG